MKKVVLGNRVKDSVTGYTGIATWKTEFLNGCIQIGVTGPASKTGEVRTMDIDESQIRYVGAGVVPRPVAPKKKKTNGGPSRCHIISRTL